MWPFSTMTPLKNYTYTTLLSHMGNVTLFYIFTLLYLITTPPKNYTRVFQSLALPLMGWTWALWALAILGLGLGFGLGPHLYFMSSFNFEKTRGKNFKCEGGCPLPPLIKAFFIWFSSSIHFVKYSMATIKYFICLIARGKGPEYRFPMCGRAMGCKSISVPLEVPCASLHASGTAYIVGRILHNLPPLMANKTLRESPWKLMIFPPRGFRKSPHEALTWSSYTRRHSHM